MKKRLTIKQSERLVEEWLAHSVDELWRLPAADYRDAASCQAAAYTWWRAAFELALFIDLRSIRTEPGGAWCWSTFVGWVKEARRSCENNKP